MQFRHVSPPDDTPLNDDGDLQLPAELAELALQLQADAQHLNHTYPVEINAATADVEIAMAPIRDADRDQAHRPTWRLVATGVVAGVFIAFCSLIQWNEPEGEPTQSREAPITVRQPVDTIPVTLPAAIQPAFLDMSGPQQEGVLDWLESKDGAEVVQVSM